MEASELGDLIEDVDAVVPVEAAASSSLLMRYGLADGHIHTLAAASA